MFVPTILISAMMMVNVPACETPSVSLTSVSILSATTDYSLGDVYVQDSDGNRTIAQVYRSESGRLYCIFPQVRSRGSNSGTPQKYWVSQTSRPGFRYEVYYNSKTWYFNL